MSHVYQQKNGCARFMHWTVTVYAGVPDLPLIKAFAPLLDRLCRVDTLFTVQQLSVPTSQFRCKRSLIANDKFPVGHRRKGQFPGISKCEKRRWHPRINYAHPRFSSGSNVWAGFTKSYPFARSAGSFWRGHPYRSDKNGSGYPQFLLARKKTRLPESKPNCKQPHFWSSLPSATKSSHCVSNYRVNLVWLCALHMPNGGQNGKVLTKNIVIEKATETFQRYRTVRFMLILACPNLCFGKFGHALLSTPATKNCHTAKIVK